MDMLDDEFVPSKESQEKRKKLEQKTKQLQTTSKAFIRDYNDLRLQLFYQVCMTTVGTIMLLIFDDPIAGSLLIGFSVFYSILVLIRS